MKRSLKIFTVLVMMLAIVSMSAFAGGEKEAEESPAAAEPCSVGVFVPGVVAGSPLYEQLVAGAERAVSEFENASIKVVEGGFNQAEWTEKMTSLAAGGEYDVIISSNPSMPFVCMDVAKSFPDQKFIFFDAYFDGNPQFATFLYNQVEQTYFLGYLAGLVTKSDMAGANPDLKLGMIVAQQYPALDKMMRPGFEKGAKAVDPGITVDFRVIGNWYDANKAADLANAMFDIGVDGIMTICGGANQGVINAAKERGKYVYFMDSNEYAQAPGTILGCGVLEQERLVYEVMTEAIQGKVEFGTASILHARDGYVDFIDTDPLYTDNVPADIQADLKVVVDQIRNGKLVLEVPEL